MHIYYLDFHTAAVKIEVNKVSRCEILMCKCVEFKLMGSLAHAKHSPKRRGVFILKTIFGSRSIYYNICIEIEINCLCLLYLAIIIIIMYLLTPYLTHMSNICIQMENGIGIFNFLKKENNITEQRKTSQN